MASAFNVSGPTPVQVLVPGGSWTELGIATESGRPRFRANILRRELRADDTGDEPAEIVHLGVTGTLSFVLEKWDEAVRVSLLSNLPGGAAEGEHGTIGALWRADSHLIGVRYLPVIAGKQARTYASCVPTFIEEAEFGNSAKSLACEFMVLRTQDSAGTNASTDNLYTTTTTT